MHHRLGQLGARWAPNQARRWFVSSGASKENPPSSGRQSRGSARVLADAAAVWHASSIRFFASLSLSLARYQSVGVSTMNRNVLELVLLLLAVEQEAGTYSGGPPARRGCVTRTRTALMEHSDLSKSGGPTRTRPRRAPPSSASATENLRRAFWTVAAATTGARADRALSP